MWTLHTILSRPIHYKMPFPKHANGKLLDIGCGTGSFLASMKRSGWGAYGVELSPVACEYAERNEGLNVFNGTVEDASFPNDFFDAVTMLQVLEHTQDPAGTLREVYRILKADGLLTIGVPNAASWESKLFGSRWGPWEIPRHLYHFSPTTITALLEKNGFSVIDIKYDGIPNGFLWSMQYVFADVKLNPKIGFALAYPLAYLVSVFALVFRSAGSIAVFAKKRMH